MTEQQMSMSLRLTLALIGALAGISFWLLFEKLPDLVENERVVLALAAFAALFFGGMLLLTGVISLRRALSYAIVYGAISAGLLLWASYRFVSLDGFLDSFHPAVAFFGLAFLPLPFFIAADAAPGGWRDYGWLFDSAWGLVVRGVAAWCFAGLFWLVIFLSDQLLNLVGFAYLGDLVENAWVAMPLTGLILGLALAVLSELGSIVATLRRLALQLLRLLLPFVAVVIALFILLVPFRGLDAVFGALSAAGTMLAMAVGAITLITSAVDARESDQANSRLMGVAARGLSLLLPVIAAIAAYAIWVRVTQYGWTPPRIVAVLTAGVVLAYAVAYAGAILLGARWRQGLRAINTWMALVLIALSGLWLTPVLDAEAISARSQVDRYLAGETSVEDLDIWRLGEDWGRSGVAALERLRTAETPPDAVALAAKIARFDTGVSRWNSVDSGAVRSETREALLAEIPVRPEGQFLRAEMIATLPDFKASNLLQACRRLTPTGQPGCVAVMGRFALGESGVGAVFFGQREDAGDIERFAVLPDGDGYRYVYAVDAISGDWDARAKDGLIPRIQAGDFALRPQTVEGLVLGDLTLVPEN